MTTNVVLNALQDIGVVRVVAATLVQITCGLLLGSHHQKVALCRKEHMVNYIPLRARNVSASNANELGRSRA